MLAAPAAAAPPTAHGGSYQLQAFVLTGGSSPGEQGKVNLFGATSRSALTGSLVGTSNAVLTCTQVVGRTISCHGTTTFEGTSEGEATVVVSTISFRCSSVTDRCSGRSTDREATGPLAGTHGVTTLEQVLSTGAGTYSTRRTGG